MKRRIRIWRLVKLNFLNKMGFLDYKVKKTFEKIFKGVAKDLGCEVSDLKIGIVFKGEECVYEAYNEKEKDSDGACKIHVIDLNKYLGILDSGVHVISATIGQASYRFAREVSEKHQKEVKPNEVSVLLKPKEGELPLAALMAFGKAERMIDIKTEFSQS